MRYWDSSKHTVTHMVSLKIGKDFKNNKKTFSNKNGSPRSPTTQGLVEKAKKSLKEDIRMLIVSTNRETNT